MIEALCTGIFAGISGIISECIISVMLKQLIAGIGIPIEIKYSISNLIYYVLRSVLLTVVSSISMSNKFSKLNIVKSLKYE